jgi:DNA-binding transcriptional LysR family regulator
VSDGRLVRPFARPLQSARGYYLVAAKGRREPNKLKLFRNWLADETLASARGYRFQNPE